METWRLMVMLAGVALTQGCRPPEPPNTSVVSVGIYEDVGVEFEAAYMWSDGKRDTLSGKVIRDGDMATERFHNGTPDDRRITSLNIKSVSGTGMLGVRIKRKGKNGETIEFEGQASGEGATISYNVP